MPTDNNSSYKLARLGLVEAESALRHLAAGLRDVVDDPEFTAEQRQDARERAEHVLRLADRLRSLQVELLAMIGSHRLPESVADLRQLD